MGRFWEPSDRIPDPHEPAVLTLFDVEDLASAWAVVNGLVEVERELLSR